MGTTHFYKVSGKNGVYVGGVGSEKTIADASGNLYQAGTQITATAAELNQVDGIAGAALAAIAAGKKVAYGVTSVTGSADITSGLATVESVIACLGQDPDTATGGACTATADLSGTAGNIILKCWDSAFAAATVAADVNWIAIGT